MCGRVRLCTEVCTYLCMCGACVRVCVRLYVSVLPCLQAQLYMHPCWCANTWGGNTFLYNSNTGACVSASNVCLVVRITMCRCLSEACVLSSLYQAPSFTHKGHSALPSSAAITVFSLSESAHADQAVVGCLLVKHWLQCCICMTKYGVLLHSMSRVSDWLFVCCPIHGVSCAL